MGEKGNGQTGEGAKAEDTPHTQERSGTGATPPPKAGPQAVAGTQERSQSTHPADAHDWAKPGWTDEMPEELKRTNIEGVEGMVDDWIKNNKLTEEEGRAYIRAVKAFKGQYE